MGERGGEGGAVEVAETEGVSSFEEGEVAELFSFPLGCFSFLGAFTFFVGFSPLFPFSTFPFFAGAVVAVVGGRGPVGERGEGGDPTSEEEQEEGGS